MALHNPTRLFQTNDTIPFPRSRPRGFDAPRKVQRKPLPSVPAVSTSPINVPKHSTRSETDCSPSSSYQSRTFSEPTRVSSSSSISLPATAEEKSPLSQACDNPVKNHAHHQPPHPAVHHPPSAMPTTKPAPKPQQQGAITPVELMDLWAHASLLSHNGASGSALSIYRSILSRPGVPRPLASRLQLNTGILLSRLNRHEHAAEAFYASAMTASTQHPATAAADHIAALAVFSLGCAAFDVGAVGKARDCFDVCLSYFEPATGNPDGGAPLLDLRFRTLGLAYTLSRADVRWNRLRCIEREAVERRMPMRSGVSWALNRPPQGVLFEPPPPPTGPREPRRRPRYLECAAPGRPPPDDHKEVVVGPSVEYFPEEGFADESSIDESHIEESPINESPIDESPIDENNIDESPIHESPREATPAEQLPTSPPPIPLTDNPTSPSTTQPTPDASAASTTPPPRPRGLRKPPSRELTRAEARKRDEEAQQRRTRILIRLGDLRLNKPLPPLPLSPGEPRAGGKAGRATGFRKGGGSGRQTRNVTA